jgi:ribonuclease R
MKKGSKIKDPHARREADKYENPIPSREVILALLGDRREMMKMPRLAQELGLESEQALDALGRRLRAMLRDGQLFRNRREGFGVAQELDLIPGRVTGHADGFGFLIPDAGGDDLYLPAKQMRQVLHGDRVLARTTSVDRRGRKEGAIVEVLERANSHLVGRFFNEKGVTFVVADERRVNQDILVPPGEAGKAQSGDYVYLELIEQPQLRRQPVGRVLEVLGQSINAPMAVEVALRSYDIPFRWPDGVLEAAESIPDHVDTADLKGRKDLRDWPLVTIDGSDARDFDDAVCCFPSDKGGWRVLVAIADVAHYVQPGDIVDTEALERGTSAYFPNRVVPMLPEHLSNGICSLKPKVDRLCLVCDMHLGADAKVIRSRFYSAVMHSQARLTYEQVWDFLSGDDAGQDLSEPVVDSLRGLHAMYKAMRKRRARRGALDFGSREAGFLFDAEGEVSEIVAIQRNDAHCIIEECMIAANVQAARWLEKQKIPALFRVHASPPERKREALRIALSEMGIGLPAGDEIKPRDLSQILSNLGDRPDRDLIQMLILRSQSLAAYQADNGGHFGLALESYAHFTSPIRRYPDLMVHRALHHGLARGTADDYGFNEGRMKTLASHCSQTERRAEEASRDVDQRLKCAYMASHVGGEFKGVISGVKSFGVFVELDGLQVSGMVHVTQLPNDYYHFDPVSHTLTGERRRMILRLADPVTVEVLRVDLDEREIDFKLVGQDG